MIWVIIALVVFIFQVLTILIVEYRHPSKAVAWQLILFVFPLIGFVTYYFMAKEFQRKRTVRRHGIVSTELRLRALRRTKLIHRISDLGDGQFIHQERLFHLLQSFSMSPITSCNKIEVLQNGHETYEQILKAIEQAEDHIHMEYYTIRDDRIGERFKEVLIRKAMAGVQVRIIYDGVGSYETHGSYFSELESAGIQTCCFLPPRLAFFEKRMNYRNHRKIVIIDGTTGFLGGINIGDEYLNGNSKLGFWRDTHLGIYGDAVYSLQDIFMRDWWFAAREKLSGQNLFPEHQCQSNEQVQIVSSGPDSSANAVLECYFNAIAVAKSRIYITSPYFIPDTSLLMGLRTAALSGVDVRLIIPQVCDSQIVMFASLSYVEELLEAGVRIYRYQKGFIHSKTLIVDRLLASIGTANIDMRSFFSNFELTAILFNSGSIEQVEKDFRRDLQASEELRLSSFKSRPRLHKIGEAASRLLSPLL
ncbi:cardiolipin synthase [Paenibacillus sp. GCM10012307]|uniref:Cardiolipin synthase n=1 Tax=Paenibacillus roseus TaxID=2798579 RepID=A0A934J3M8_9BACL|nr:cardiolipin synthase [Paenibacillus roseus]MBJ6360231.1 cardiolipin synthase [Paenibacillus roseus]